MQSVRPIFFFFGFWGEGEREIFFLFPIGGGGPVIHPWDPGRKNTPPPPLRMCCCLGKACVAPGGEGGGLCCNLTGHK
jgi:hypothetical protein